MKYFQIGLIVMVLSLTSCTSSKKNSSPSGAYVVNTQNTPFYRYGPAQASGADFALTKGQRVTLVKKSFGFSQVETDDGQTGYVSTDDLLPAPVATPTPTPTSRQIPKHKSRPVPEPQDLSLPLPWDAGTEPAPGFRY